MANPIISHGVMEATKGQSGSPTSSHMMEMTRKSIYAFASLTRMRADLDVMALTSALISRILISMNQTSDATLNGSNNGRYNECERSLTLF